MFRMKVYNMVVYLNGIRMSDARQAPIVDADRFIRNVMDDLISPNDKKKHRCTDFCNAVWTIGIGPSFTDKKTFIECAPR